MLIIDYWMSNIFFPESERQPTILLVANNLYYASSQGLDSTHTAFEISVVGHWLEWEEKPIRDWVKR